MFFKNIIKLNEFFFLYCEDGGFYRLCCLVILKIKNKVSLVFYV